MKRVRNSLKGINRLFVKSVSSRKLLGKDHGHVWSDSLASSRASNVFLVCCGKSWFLAGIMCSLML